MQHKDWNTFVCGSTDGCESVEGIDRERERERETTLETKINNIRTNYIQYTVGDPFI